MHISIDWISDFVKLPDISAKELGSKITLGCCEVEDVITTNSHVEKVVVAEILSFEPHPEADKLNLVTFKHGPDKTSRVVCGASNVRVGLKTFYAPTGVTLPNGLTLEPKKIRGVLSEGMLCSEEELGWAEESSGIIDLPSDAVVGTTLAKYKGEKGDTLLDIDNKSLTHRPDLWGHYGMAREFAAIFESPLACPYDEAWKKKLKAKISGGNAPVKVKMKGESAGLAYYGLSVSGVAVAPSPDWMQARLKAVGLRPINNMVDISNYVMLELGMPLHIFDRDQIKGGEVVIHALESDVKFTTLDEVERDLKAGDTVISDASGPLVLAGIMGGLSSGVSDSTKNLFIEVANWKSAMVRRTSTRLGLRSDSSQRYEKTLDSLLCERTLYRTLELILELCPNAKVEGDLQYDGMNLSDIKPLQINTSVSKIEKVLGHNVGSKRVVSILSALDFGVKESGDKLELTVPSFRATKDIEGEADIIEEIGRIVGFDHIAATSPLLPVSPVSLTPAQKLHREMRQFMSLHAGALEIMTYPLIGEKLLKKVSWESDASNLKLINALSEEHDRMRPSLIPSLLEVAALNAKNMSEFTAFEIGRSYQGDAKNFASESTMLGAISYSQSTSTFMKLQDNLERMMSALNIPGDFTGAHPKFKNEVVSESWAGVHPYEFVNVRLMGKMKGVVFTLHPLIARSLKIKGHLSLAILDLSTIEERPLKDKVKYRPLPKFPSSDFDWTVVMSADKSVLDILESVKKVKIPELQEVVIHDVFQMNENERAITLRASFQDLEKTLSGEVLTAASEKLMQATNNAGFPLKN